MKDRPKHRRLDAHEIRRVAVRGLVDPRTVERFLDGRPIRALSARRIRDAMRALRIGVAMARSQAA